MGLGRRIAIVAFCVPLFLGVASHAQEDQETSVTIKAPKPEAAEGVLSEFRPLRIGYIYVNDFYSEPGVMTEKGDLHGVTMTFEKFGERPHILGRISGDLSVGQLNYDGGLQKEGSSTVEPYQTSGQDYIFNIKASAGFPISFGNRVQVLHLIGYGYRYLNDQLEGRGAYEREISYTYLPLALEFRFFFNRGFALTVAYEYDHFIAGQVKSHLSQVGKSHDLVNTQSEGRGDRITVDFVKALESGKELHIAPYIQGWNMARSDVLELDGHYGWNEPPNYTFQYGLGISVGL